MSRRGVRVLDGYDAEYGVIVAGTLDAEAALPLAIQFELDRRGFDPDDEDAETVEAKDWAETWMRRGAEAKWLRTVPAPPDNLEGWTWMIWPADDGERGAFRAVEFRRQ